MTKVPPNPRRLARRPRGALPVTAGLLVLLAMALSAPARAGELPELPEPELTGGAVAEVDQEFGGVAAPQLPGEAEAPGSAPQPTDPPAVEQPVIETPEVPPPEVEASPLPAEPPPIPEVAPPPVEEEPPEPLAQPPELPDTAPLVPDAPSPGSIGNLNVDIRILSPGDDGDVSQVIDGFGGPPRPVSGGLPADFDWDWDWNWTCAGGDAPFSVAGWDWDWNWSGDCGGSLGRSVDPEPNAPPPTAPPNAQPLADSVPPVEAMQAEDKAPRKTRPPASSPASYGEPPSPVTSFVAAAPPPLAAGAVAPPARAAPERPSSERRVRAERAEASHQELPLAGSAASTAPTAGGGPSLLLVVLLGALSLLAPRAAEPAWMRARRLRSLIASERLERPG